MRLTLLLAYVFTYTQKVVMLPVILFKRLYHEGYLDDPFAVIASGLVVTFIAWIFVYSIYLSIFY